MGQYRYIDITIVINTSKYSYLNINGMYRKSKIENYCHYKSQIITFAPVRGGEKGE